MKTDMVVRADVLDELESEGLHAARIGVGVQDGVVTLTGEVETYGVKADAERAALRVSGVKVVADELHVRLVAPDVRSDADIARAAAVAPARRRAWCG